MVEKIENQVEWEASDGRTFDNEEEAERYEALIEIRDTYKRARKDYARTLAKTFKTADGQPFNFSQWSYYWVTPWHYHMPRVQKVEIWKPDFDIPENHPEEGTFICGFNGANGKRETRPINISELYASQSAASSACLVAARERLVELQENLKEWERKAKEWERKAKQ